MLRSAACTWTAALFLLLSVVAVHMKRKRGESWELNFIDPDMHRLDYVVRQMDKPFSELDIGLPPDPSPADAVQHAIDFIATHDVKTARFMRDAFIARTRLRDKHMRDAGEVQRWHLEADSKAKQIRGGANGPLMLALLAEAGGDIGPLQEILNHGTSPLPIPLPVPPCVTQSGRCRNGPRRWDPQRPG